MDRNKRNQKSEKNKLYVLIACLTIVIIGIITLVLILVNNKNQDNEKNLAYTELITSLNNQEIEKIEMTVGSTTVKVKLKGEDEEKTAIVPNTQAFIELIQEQVK